MMLRLSFGSTPLHPILLDWPILWDGSMLGRKLTTFCQDHIPTYLKSIFNILVYRSCTACEWAHGDHHILCTAVFTLEQELSGMLTCWEGQPEGLPYLIYPCQKIRDRQKYSWQYRNKGVVLSCLSNYETVRSCTWQKTQGISGRNSFQCRILNRNKPFAPCQLKFVSHRRESAKQPGTGI